MSKQCPGPGCWSYNCMEGSSGRQAAKLLLSVAGPALFLGRPAEGLVVSRVPHPDNKGPAAAKIIQQGQADRTLVARDPAPRSHAEERRHYPYV